MTGHWRPSPAEVRRWVTISRALPAGISPPMLNELAWDWETQSRKWDEQNSKREKQKAEDRRKWEESNWRSDVMNKHINHSISALP